MMQYLVNKHNGFSHSSVVYTSPAASAQQFSSCKKLRKLISYTQEQRPYKEEYTSAVDKRDCSLWVHQFPNHASQK